MLLTATHLLRNHDNARGLNRAAATRYREQLNEAREEGAFGRKAGFLDQDFFSSEQSMGIVEIASGLNGRGAKPQKGFERLAIPLLLHQPSWGLGAEENANNERNGGNESATKLETPGGNPGDVLDCQVRTGP